MRAYTVARIPTIDKGSGSRFSDAELERCGFLKYGPVHEVDELTTDVFDELADEFERLYPSFRNAKYEVVTVE